MRIMGLDIGDKTVGVALSDALLIAANPLTTVERVGIRKDTTRIIEIADENEVSVIVAGLPLMLSGEDSPQTLKVREFAEMLSNKIRSSGRKIEVVFQDERFSTRIAENVLIEADLSRKKRKAIIDKQAAVVILQAWLDKKRLEKEREEKDIMS